MKTYCFLIVLLERENDGVAEGTDGGDSTVKRGRRGFKFSGERAR
jgi:hypothetical protein